MTPFSEERHAVNLGTMQDLDKDHNDNEEIMYHDEIEETFRIETMEPAKLMKRW